MKSYKKVADKIRKMGSFSEIYNCGNPTSFTPVNLYFQLCEAYVIGYTFYICYNGTTWSIDYTLDPSVTMRCKMQSIRGIKTDREMYQKVKEIIDSIREQCKTTK